MESGRASIKVRGMERAEEELSEWQPARLYPGHPSEDYVNLDSDEELKLITRAVVRVRPYDPVATDSLGCDGKYLEIHPDDAANLGIPDNKRYVCEHEVLTD